MIKLATLDDVPEIKEMAMQFIRSTAYKNFADEAYIETVALQLLAGPQTENIVLLKPGVGMLAAKVHPFPFGPHLVATEICWWVNPDHRATNEGEELVSAFEYWAKNIAMCEIVTFSALNNKLDKFFKRKGYKLREKAYMKTL